MDPQSHMEGGPSVGHYSANATRDVSDYVYQYLDDVEVVLDISRLVSRVHHRTPTGVDRVEFAYAKELLTLIPERLSFAAVHPCGLYGRLPVEAVRSFLEKTEGLWAGTVAHGAGRWGRGADLLKTLWAMRPRSLPKSRAARRILIQSSPHHLHDEKRMRAILGQEGAQFVCLLHDLIPIEFPEYARPGGAALHLRRVETVARLAAAVVSNSAATQRSFLPYLAAAGRDIPVEVAHLGLEPSLAGDAPTADGHPYFLCLGTIEPRKNHLLLLNIWRRLVEQFGAAAVPKLKIVGRRGWENEQVIDMLERCPALIGCVEEYAGLGDKELHRLMKGARALLLPSFAEGFGMPVPEALAMGVPVICSDLPALREAGGAVPEYLDLLDGPAWIAAIMDFVEDGSARRSGQMERMALWAPPTWNGHVRSILALLKRLA